MLTTRQNLPPMIPSAENLPVLLVTPHPDDEAVLRDLLPIGDQALVNRCSGVEDAMPQIRAAEPAVVICERDLPDGSWKTILGACEALQKRPVLVVISRHADENLWAEVLNLGGYDVLLKPFEPSEVKRMFTSSCRQWSGAVERLPVASEPGTAALTAQFA